MKFYLLVVAHLLVSVSIGVIVFIWLDSRALAFFAWGAYWAGVLTKKATQ